MIKIFSENFLDEENLYLKYLRTRHLSDDKCLVVSNLCKPIELVYKAANEFKNYYSIDSVKILSKRHKLFDFLNKEFNFSLTKTKIITSVEEIDFSPFIVKPVFSSHFKNLQTGQRDSFSFKIFNSKDDILKVIDENNLNKHLQTSLYIIQETSTNSILFRIAGVVNSLSEICFQRTSISKINFNIENKSKYLNENQEICLRTFNDDFLNKEKQLIQNLIKSLNIKCAPFTMEFIKIEDEFKPIDWNFNFSPFYNNSVSLLNKDEIFHFLDFMFDLTENEFYSNQDIIIHQNKVKIN